MEHARANVEQNRSGELDWLFYRRWRLSDGWLSDEASQRALEIFHDPLAQNMRRAVISERYDGRVAKIFEGHNYPTKGVIFMLC